MSGSNLGDDGAQAIASLASFLGGIVTLDLEGIGSRCSLHQGGINSTQCGPEVRMTKTGAKALGTVLDKFSDLHFINFAGVFLHLH